MKKLFIPIIMLIFSFSGITYAETFSSDDLVGNWRGCFLESKPSNETRTLRNTDISISSTVYAVSGTWSDKTYDAVPSGNGNITGGSINITARDEITGSIDIIDTGTSDTETITIVNGWMDIEKIFCILLWQDLKEIYPWVC